MDLDGIHHFLLASEWNDDPLLQRAQQYKHINIKHIKHIKQTLFEAYPSIQAKHWIWPLFFFLL